MWHPSRITQNNRGEIYVLRSLFNHSATWTCSRDLSTCLSAIQDGHILSMVVPVYTCLGVGKHCFMIVKKLYINTVCGISVTTPFIILHLLMCRVVQTQYPKRFSCF